MLYIALWQTGTFHFTKELVCWLFVDELGRNAFTTAFATVTCGRSAVSADVDQKGCPIEREIFDHNAHRMHTENAHV